MILLMMCLLFLQYFCPLGVATTYDLGVPATSVTTAGHHLHVLNLYTHFDLLFLVLVMDVHLDHNNISVFFFVLPTPVKLD